MPACPKGNFPEKKVFLPRFDRFDRGDNRSRPWGVNRRANRSREKTVEGTVEQTVQATVEEKSIESSCL